MTNTALDSPLRDVASRLGADDPAWLAAARLSASERYESLPQPSRVAHIWRYTDPDRVTPSADAICATAGAAAPGLTGTPADTDAAAGHALSHGGRLHAAQLDPSLAARGVLFGDLRAAAREHEDLVRPRLGSLTASCEGLASKIDALSLSAFAGGAFIRVPRGVQIERPLLVASTVTGSGLVASRSLIELGEGSTATVVIDLASDSEATCQLHDATEVFVGAGAHLRIVYVQALGRKATHAPSLRARVERNGRIEMVSVALGGKVVKGLQTVELAAPGSEANVVGIVFGDGRQHFDHHTFIDHLTANSSSNLDYRTVVAGRARSVYTGRLRIGLDGAGCEAHQKNHNLVLSKRARADTIPELEILTNDVSCSHAATVGPLDPEQLYFCMSRGLSEPDAQRLIVEGFLEPTLDRIPGEALAESVRQSLAGRMEGSR